MFDLNKISKIIIFGLLTLITSAYTNISILYLNKETTPLLFKISISMINLVLILLFYLKFTYFTVILCYLFSFTNLFACIFGPRINDIDSSVVKYLINKNVL